MNVYDVCRDVLKIESLSELKAFSEQINVAINIRYAELQQRAAIRLGIGSRVEFTDKLGNVVKGRVLKLNTKTVMVRSDVGSEWRVSPSLLRVAA